MRSFQVLNHFTVQGCAAKGYGKRFPMIQAEAERFKEFGFAVVVRLRGVEQIVGDLLALNQGFVCVWEFHAMKV